MVQARVDERLVYFLIEDSFCRLYCIQNLRNGGIKKRTKEGTSKGKPLVYVVPQLHCLVLTRNVTAPSMECCGHVGMSWPTHRCHIRLVPPLCLLISASSIAVRTCGMISISL
jgi:hypothetical protein